MKGREMKRGIKTGREMTVETRISKEKKNDKEINRRSAGI